MIVRDVYLWLRVSALLKSELSMCVCMHVPSPWPGLKASLCASLGRLCGVACAKILACWSNGHRWKGLYCSSDNATPLSDSGAGGKCPQFVFCSSVFLTLAVTFPSACPYIPPLLASHTGKRLSFSLPMWFLNNLILSLSNRSPTLPLTNAVQWHTWDYWFLDYNPNMLRQHIAITPPATGTISQWIVVKLYQLALNTELFFYVIFTVIFLSRTGISLCSV